MTYDVWREGRKTINFRHHIEVNDKRITYEKGSDEGYIGISWPSEIDVDEVKGTIGDLDEGDLDIDEEENTMKFSTQDYGFGLRPCSRESEREVFYTTEIVDQSANDETLQKMLEKDFSSDQIEKIYKELEGFRRVNLNRLEEVSNPVEFSNFS